MYLHDIKTKPLNRYVYLSRIAVSSLYGFDNKENIIKGQGKVDWDISKTATLFKTQSGNVKRT